MKRFLLLLSFILPVFVFGQVTTMRLASDHWPPFTQQAPGEAVASNLVSEALRKQYIITETEITDFDQVLDGLRNRKYDGSAALWLSKERARFLLYSEPYLTNQLILVGRKGSNVDVDALDELHGKRVGIVEAYAYGSALGKSEDISYVPGKNDEDNLHKLLKGEIDYMLVDALLIQYLLKYQSADAEAYLAIGTIPLLTRTLHFAIRRDYPHAEQIIEAFNTHITQMVVDGTYHKILHLDWVQADIDGDGRPELILDGRHAGTDAPVHPYSIMFSERSDTPPDQNRYVVEGRIYEAWDQIPAEYKMPPPDDFSSGVRLLNFRF